MIVIKKGELTQINAFKAGFLFKDTVNIEYPNIMLRFYRGLWGE